MNENRVAESTPSVVSLLGSILEDAQKLVRQEVALARCEIAEAAEKAKTGFTLLSSALVVCAVGGVLLGFMLVRVLHNLLLPADEWASFGIVGALVILIGGVLVLVGRAKINEVHLSPTQTTETLREDAQAVGAALTENRAAAGILLK
jgi:NADH:ubiquinone oxidoreductase subunit 6 (subunit J)